MSRKENPAMMATVFSPDKELKRAQEKIHTRSIPALAVFGVCVVLIFTRCVRVSLLSCFEV